MPHALAALAAVLAFAPLTAAVAKDTGSGWDKVEAAFKKAFHSGKADAREVADNDDVDGFKAKLAKAFHGKDDDDGIDLGFKSPFKK
jgi:hypothetical protein